MTVTDLNSLVIFAKVVEAKSFSEAARRLKMPISTVSRRIAELEDELGVRKSRFHGGFPGAVGRGSAGGRSDRACLEDKAELVLGCH